MRHLATLCLVLAIVVGANAQTTTTFDDLGEFTGVRVSSAFQVDLVRGDAYAAEVTVPDRVADRVSVEVDDGILVIELKRGSSVNMRGRERLSAVVTLPMLEAIDASGATEVRSEDRWEGDALAIGASGAADIELDLAVNSLAISASGASDIDLTGEATQLTVDCSGASDVDAEELIAANVTVSSSGASDVSVHAEESIVATASGGSDIRYSGKAERVSVDASGGSDIHGPKGQ